jgi:hypothetical protein
MKKILSSLLIFFCIAFPDAVFAGVNTHSLITSGPALSYLTKSTPTGLPTVSGARTIMAWVQTATTTEGYVFCHGGQNSNLGFGLTVGNNLIFARIEGGNQSWTATNVNNNTWHHVAISYGSAANITDNTNVKAYMDGVLLTQSTGGSGTPNTNSDFVRVGSSCDTVPATGLSAQIDDVQIYNTNLSQASIQAAMSNCELSDAAANLVGRWRLDNSPNDSTSNANNLTPVSSPTYSPSTGYTCGVIAPNIYLKGNAVLQGVLKIMAR